MVGRDLPNGVKAQVLDLLDYVSNNIMMPVLEIGTCILIGWVATPDSIVDELTANGERFMRRKLYAVMIRYVVPLLLCVLLVKSTDWYNKKLPMTMEELAWGV